MDDNDDGAPLVGNGEQLLVTAITFKFNLLSLCLVANGSAAAPSG